MFFVFPSVPDSEITDVLNGRPGGGGRKPKTEKEVFRSKKPQDDQSIQFVPFETENGNEVCPRATKEVPREKSASTP